MEYSKLTVKKLRSLIKGRWLEIPSSGSGKNGNIIRIDLINTLKYDDLLPKTLTPTKVPTPVKTLILPSSTHISPPRVHFDFQPNTSKYITGINEFDKLSNDAMMKIAYDLTPRTTVKYCSLSKKFANICNNKYFWIKKYKLDFDDYDEIRPSIRDVYTFKANLNKDLVDLLIEYSFYDEYNYENKKKLYNNALETFKDIEKYNEYVWEYFDIKKILGKRAIAYRYSDKDELKNDYELINKLVAVHNSIMDTNYQFN